MKLLKTITDADLFPGIQPRNRKKYSLQQSARAVVFDADNNVGLLFTPFYQIHKLPGGTINSHESPREALIRECKEELGCAITNIKEIGTIDEYKDKRQEHRSSFLFTATVGGNKGQPDFTLFELEGKFEIKWVPLKEAISLCRADQPTDYDGHFIRARDLYMLQYIASNSN